MQRMQKETARNLPSLGKFFSLDRQKGNALLLPLSFRLFELYDIFAQECIR